MSARPLPDQKQCGTVSVSPRHLTGLALCVHQECLTKALTTWANNLPYGTAGCEGVAQIWVASRKKFHDLRARFPRNQGENRFGSRANIQRNGQSQQRIHCFFKFNIYVHE